MFDKLGAPSDVTRRNALEALSEALARGAGQAGKATMPSAPGPAAQELSPEYAALLAEKILPCLSDTSLPTRGAAAALLGRLSPSCVLPPLVRLLGARDARTRSAAAEALAAVLRHHVPPSRALAALLACITAPQEAEAADGSAGDTSMERAIGVLGKWAASHIAPEQWPPLIDELVRALTAAPSDPVLVRCAAALGPHMGASGGPCAHVLHCVHALLASQPEAPQASAPESDVFVRLQPLLLLRVLPLDAFTDELAEEVLYSAAEFGATTEAPHGGAPCIASILLARMCDANEPAEVRRVSAELAGRLRPDVAWPALLSRTLDAERATDFPRLRACLFAACAALAARGAAAIPGSVPPSRALLRALTGVLVFDGVADNAALTEEELMKTQMGCIDCLAMLCAAQLAAAPGAMARIEVLGGDSQGDAECVADVLSPLLDVATCARDAPPWHDAPVLPAVLPSLRACCANVVITASKHATSRAHAPLARRVLPVVAR